MNRLLALIPLLIFNYYLGFTQCAEPQPGIEYCSTDEFCSKDSVCVLITAEDPNVITYFEVDWGDDTGVERVVSTGELKHKYDEENVGCEVKEFTIKVKAIHECADGSQEDATVAAFVTVIPPPDVTNGFDMSPSALCLPQNEIQVTYASCPSEFVEVCYNFGSSGNVCEKNPILTFEGAGSYPISMTVESFADEQSCGVATFRDTLEVFEPPTAQVDFQTNRSQDADIFESCTNEEAIFVNTSSFADDGEWRIRPRGSVDIVSEDKDRLVVIFNEIGTFTISYEAKSDHCNSDIFEQEIQVGATPILSFPLDTSSCDSVQVNPSTFVEILPGGIYVDYEWDLGSCGTSNLPDPSTCTYVQNETISLRVSNQCGADQATGSVAITQPGIGQISMPSGFFTQGDTLILCQGVIPTISFQGSPFGANWEGGSYINQEGIFDLEVAGIGDHAIYYGNDCIIKDSVVVRVIGQNIEYIVDSTLCKDDPITIFEASPNLGEWSGGDFITSDGQFNPQLTTQIINEVKYEYQVGVASVICSFSETFDIEVLDLSFSFDVSNCETGDDGIEVCFELDREFMDDVEVRYAFGDDSFSDEFEPCHTYSTSGSYRVRVEITKDHCSYVYEETIFVEPSPMSRFTFDNASSNNRICFSDSLQLLNQSTGGNGEYEWEWNGEVFSMDRLPVPFLLPQSQQFTDTIHYFKLTAFGSCGNDVFEDSIIVLPGVEASFGREPDSACAWDTIYINNNSRGNPTFQNWSLDGASLDSSFNIDNLVLDEGTYSIELQTGNDCGSDTLSKQIDIYPPNVIAHFEVPEPQICLGSQIELYSFATPNNASIRWLLGDSLNNTAVGDTVLHSYAYSDTFLITQIVRQCGVDTFQRSVIVHPRPSLELEHESEICEGVSMDFRIYTNGSEYTISYTSLDSSNNNLLSTHTFDSAGIYDINVQSRTEVGCLTELNSQVEVHPSPTVSMLPPDTICSGAQYTYASTSTVSVEKALWSFPIDNSQNNLFGETLEFTYENPGIYPIKLYVETDKGCVDSTQTTITVFETPDVFFVIDSTPVCAPAIDICLNDLSTGIGSSQYRCEWKVDGQTVSQLQSPCINFEEAGVFEVSLTKTSLEGCKDTYNDQMVVYPTPQADIQADWTENCAPMPVSLSFSPTPYTELVWEVEGAPVSQEAAFDFIFLNASENYTLTLKLSYEGLCNSEDSIEFQPVTRPFSDFGIRQPNVHTREVELRNYSLDATNYEWYDGDTLISTLENPFYTLPHIGVHEILLYAYNGEYCFDSTRRSVNYFDEEIIWVPNAFTPNGDGINDGFSFYVRNAAELVAKIFNRQGKLLHTWRTGNFRGFVEPWDVKDRYIQEGVYTLHIKVTLQSGEVIERGATVTLIR